MKIAVLGVLASWLVAGEDTITIENFAAAKYTWKAYNDPVMGGRSYSSLEMEDNTMRLTGEVKTLPKPFPPLPGFVQAKISDSNDWPDLSECTGMALTMRSMTPYERFFVSFGYSKPAEGERYAWGHKARFKAPRDKFDTVEIAFDQFSNYWKASTGDIIVSCEENSKYCPTANELRNFRTMAIWGEGEAGPVDIDVKEIYAYGCSKSKKEKVPEDDQCGHDGYLLRTRNRLRKIKKVDNACRCGNMCKTLEKTSAWTFKKNNGLCQCLNLNKRGKKGYRVKKNSKYAASHNA